LILSKTCPIIPATTINDGELLMNVISPQSPAFPNYLRRVDAARYIQDTYGIPCQAPTLAKYACLGGGPVFRKAGKFPIYSRDDLDAWAEQRLSKLVHSTSELIGREA
jgi:hypothetical protein